MNNIFWAGLICLLIGYFAGIGIVATIGWILLIVGLVITVVNHL